jgi:capsular polysaccharide export protein
MPQPSKFFFGFSYWKHEFIKVYFPKEQRKTLQFINPFFVKNSFKLAKKKGLGENSEVYIWGRKGFEEIEEYIQKNSLKLYRIEDGFIRSVGLGSDLTQPYSLVIDSRGIYFDPTQESDLEYILQNSDFDETLLNRAKKLRAYLLEKKLSKYNLYENKALHIPKDKKIVLVPGQVEDDASIKYGAAGMTNLELLKSARENAKDAYVIYKPHPDVLVGNRVGHIEESEALQYADVVVTEVGLDSVLEVADEVHTMTSLVGFEALMREKKVFAYGAPFYAGWGLTYDAQSIQRRDRKLSLDELVAATLILYPKYIHPKRLDNCQVEDLLLEIDAEKEYLKKHFFSKLIKNVRNYCIRKILKTLRIITQKKEVV